MAKTKTCFLCRKEIDLANEDYVRVTDYHFGKFFSEGFYHMRCYLDKLNKTQELQKKAEGLLNKAASLLGAKKEEEEYVIS